MPLTLGWWRTNKIYQKRCFVFRKIPRTSQGKKASYLHSNSAFFKYFAKVKRNMHISINKLLVSPRFVMIHYTEFRTHWWNSNLFFFSLCCCSKVAFIVTKIKANIKLTYFKTFYVLRVKLDNVYLEKGKHVVFLPR